MSEDLINPLIQSVVGPLANKIKSSVRYARKNVKLAQTLTNTIDLLCEQLLPNHLAKNVDNFVEVNAIHNLIYLLAAKSQQVFTSRIIHTAIDQNWDLKGFKQVLVRLFKTIGVTGYENMVAALDQQVKNQNLQSSSCIKAIGSFIRNPKKVITEDDLANSMSTYETDFTFIEEDIIKYRTQRIKHECFSVLHPWAYDLDQVDFKYIVNNDLTGKICSYLHSTQAQAFWLAWFKCQSAVAADDFFTALREVCQINRVPDFYLGALPGFVGHAQKNDFVFTLEQHGSMISDAIQQIVEASQTAGFCALRDQVKQYSGEFANPSLLITGLPDGFSIETSPKFACFAPFQALSAMSLRELTPSELSCGVDLQRKPFDSIPNAPASHKLHLQFEAVDTEEIKNLCVTFDGNNGLYKIGEGEANQYQIPNDKKLWESQLMIVCKDGKYYVRDLGVVHTSRIKIDKITEVQIQQDTLVDLGKVVHYHFDKVTHTVPPTHPASFNFQVLRPTNAEYMLEETDSHDPPTLRARPTWVSSDENKDLIQKEIILEASQSQNFFSIGRSMKREVQIKLKAVSADHCSIQYTPEKGWCVSEKNKDKLSSNGTFVFMKSHSQMSNHEPSDLIPLQDGMVISFINYEIRVNLEKKDSDVVAKEKEILEEQKKAMAESMVEPAFSSTVKASEAPAIEAMTEAATEPTDAAKVEPAMASPEKVVESASVKDEEVVEEQKIETASEKVAEVESVVEKVEAKDDHGAEEKPETAIVAEVAAEEVKAEEPAPVSSAVVEEVPATSHEDEKIEAVVEAKAEEPIAEVEVLPEGAKTPEKKNEESVAGSPRMADEQPVEEVVIEEAKPAEVIAVEVAAEEVKAEEPAAAVEVCAAAPVVEEKAAEVEEVAEVKAEEAPAAAVEAEVKAEEPAAAVEAEVKAEEPAAAQSPEKEAEKVEEVAAAVVEEKAAEVEEVAEVKAEEAPVAAVEAEVKAEEPAAAVEAEVKAEEPAAAVEAEEPAAAQSPEKEAEKVEEVAAAVVEEKAAEVEEVAEVKAEEPAAAVEAEVKAEEPAAAVEAEVKAEEPAAAVEAEVKAEEPAAAQSPEKEAEKVEEVAAAVVEEKKEEEAPAAAVEAEVKAEEPAAAVDEKVKPEEVEAAAPVEEQAAAVEEQAAPVAAAVEQEEEKKMEPEADVKKAEEPAEKVEEKVEAVVAEEKKEEAVEAAAEIKQEEKADDVVVAEKKDEEKVAEPVAEAKKDEAAAEAKD